MFKCVLSVSALSYRSAKYISSTLWQFQKYEIKTSLGARGSSGERWFRQEENNGDKTFDMFITDRS